MRWHEPAKKPTVFFWLVVSKACGFQSVLGKMRSEVIKMIQNDMHFLNHHFRRQDAFIPAEHGGGFIAKSPRSGCPNLAIGNKTHQLGSNWGRIPKI